MRAVPTGDASKCTVTVSIGGHGLGAGIGPTIQIGEETVITVDTKAAGKGKVTCTVCTPDGSEVDVDVVENEDGTFDIFYTAPQPGKYIICVRFGGEHVPNSPFQVTALAGDQPSVQPRYGLSSWPHSIPTPRAVSRLGPQRGPWWVSMG